MIALNIELIAEGIRESIDGVTVEVVTVNKPEGPRVGISIKPDGRNTGLVVYEDNFTGCDTIGEQIAAAVDIFEHFGGVTFDTDGLLDWDTVRDRVKAFVVNTAASADYIKGKVGVPFLDLTILFGVEVAPTNENGYHKGGGRFVITADAAEVMGVTAEELLAAAKHNARPRVTDMCDIDFMGVPCHIPLGSMYVLTDELVEYGAGTWALLADRVRDIIPSALNMFYVIPSSVSEVLILPVGPMVPDVEALNAMVRMINADMLKPSDVLADHVYFYNGKEWALTASA